MTYLIYNADIHQAAPVTGMRVAYITITKTNFKNRLMRALADALKQRAIECLIIRGIACHSAALLASIVNAAKPNSIQQLYVGIEPQSAGVLLDFIRTVHDHAVGQVKVQQPIVVIHFPY